MTKRTFAGAIAALLLAGILCMPVSAAEAEDWYSDTTVQDTDAAAQIFSDVAVSDWYYDNVMSLYEAGIVGGFGDASYRPNDTVTTGQALKMILLAAGYPEPEVVASHWARGYLNLALDEEILVRGDITDLDVSISRLLVAKVAALAMQLENTSGSYTFADAANDNVQALYDAGIVNGYGDGGFHPSQSLTRAELAAIVYRIYQYRDDEDTTTNTSDIELRTTDNGIEFIKAMEGFVSTPYWDYSQYSIGYGSACERSDYPNGITKEEADTLLRQMLTKFEAAINKFLDQYNIKVSENQYDALVSLTYNAGSSWLNSSYRLARLLIDGDYTDNELASALGIWCHVTTSSGTQINDILINRRIRETQMFLYNDYTGKNSSDFHYVIFETDCGTQEVDIAMYKSGTECDPMFEASCSGDTFLGWFMDDGTELTQRTVITDNMTVKAAWETGRSDNTDEDGDSSEGWY